MSSKGGSVPSDTTVRQVGFPEEAEPYFMALMDDATAASGAGYSPYPNQRLANQSPMTLGAYSDVQRMANSELSGLPQAMGSTYNAMNAATAGANQRYDPYQFGQFDGFNETGFSQYGGFNPAEFSQYGGFRAGPTRANVGQFDQFDFGDAQQWNPNIADQYMSPYMQSVVDVEKDQAMLDFQRQQGFRDQAAVESGAFGGSRDAVVNALAQEDLARTMGEIQARGQQRAYEDAGQKFQSDRAAQFDWLGAQAGEGARYQQDVVGELARAQQARRDELARIQAGEASELGRVQAGAAGELGRVQAGEAGELGRYEQMTADEAARVQQAQANDWWNYQNAQSAENLAAYGTNMDNYYTALGMQGDLAQQLAGLGGMQRDYDMMSTDNLAQYGTNQQAYQQAGLDIAYDDFLKQQNWEQQQLTWLSSILRGIPIEPSYTQTTYTPYNPAQQALGMGIAGIGLQQGLS